MSTFNLNNTKRATHCSAAGRHPSCLRSCHRAVRRRSGGAAPIARKHSKEPSANGVGGGDERMGRQRPGPAPGVAPGCHALPAGRAVTGGRGSGPIGVRARVLGASAPAGAAHRPRRSPSASTPWRRAKRTGLAARASTRRHGPAVRRGWGRRGSRTARRVLAGHDGHPPAADPAPTPSARVPRHGRRAWRQPAMRASRPSTKVPTISMSPIREGSTRCGSSPSTTRSARSPGARAPADPSQRQAWAPATV